MNKLLRNSLTAREVVPIGEVNNSPSMTEPDQCMSIKQIIERFAKGVSLTVNQYEPIYREEDLPAFEMMSFDELASYRQYLSEERYRLEDELRERRRKEKEKVNFETSAPPTPMPAPTEA